MNFRTPKAKLTIITPVKFCTCDLHDLAESLENQTNKNFLWIIVNGGDDKVEIKKIIEGRSIRVKVFNEKDFSIYDALNQGIKKLETEYYVVAGADDKFAKNFVELVDEELRATDADIIFGSVIVNGQIVEARQGMVWLYGMHGVGSSHSVGTIINKGMHQIHGFYSNLYPVCADQFFVLSLMKEKPNAVFLNRLFGTYGGSGFSNKNKLDYVTDFFKVQVRTNRNFAVQTLLLLFRIAKLLLKK